MGACANDGRPGQRKPSLGRWRGCGSSRRTIRTSGRCMSRSAHDRRAQLAGCPIRQPWSMLCHYLTRNRKSRLFETRINQLEPVKLGWIRLKVTAGPPKPAPEMRA